MRATLLVRSNATPTADGKLDLDNLFEKGEEESEKQRKLREELEAIDAKQRQRTRA